METVTLSSEYQVVIPPSVRKELAWRPGTRLSVFKHGGGVEFVPARSPQSLRGFLRGMDTNIERDEDRL
ncbi:MAG: AbrB/MazE/SpoVT family DNA-binding domain-containing protein [Verrucomicrobiales bacterium]|jgi:AbrB family looped-hinge helix DNA binding protein|nr:AbrB/MazE/SpoVT family DNA-binding domain-containing protein [Verrucomicrobiales bacterium]